MINYNIIIICLFTFFYINYYKKKYLLKCTFLQLLLTTKNLVTYLLFEEDFRSHKPLYIVCLNLVYNIQTSNIFTVSKKKKKRNFPHEKLYMV